MTLDEAKKIIKSECYIADLLDLDRTQTVNIALDTVIEAVERTRWIPVSERLPKEDGFYLATCDGEICGEDEPISGMAEFENGKWVDDEDDYQCVLAWMPLPEPYKAESEDKVIHNHPCEDCYYNDGDVRAECVICDKVESEDAEWSQ